MQAWIMGGLFVTLFSPIALAMGQTLAPSPPAAAPASKTPAEGMSTGEVASLLQVINTRLDQMDKRLQQLEQSAAPLARLAAKLPIDDASILALMQPDPAISALDSRLQTLSADLQELRAALPKNAPSGGAPTNTSAAIAQTGVIELVNEMASEQKVRVDGRLYTVAARTAMSITDVPSGTVTTELVGYESPKTWTIGPPKFRQCVRIRPRDVEPAPPSPLLTP